MPSLAAAAAAATLIQTAMQAQAADGTRLVQMSYSEMASVTTLGPPGPVHTHLTTAAATLSGSAFAFETGVRNIAINQGIASTSQAVTDISMNVSLPRLAP